MEERHNCPYCKMTAVLTHKDGKYILKCAKCGERECTKKLVIKLRGELER